MTRRTSTDGLMSSSDPKAVAMWERICAEHAAEGARWSALLQSMGVKLEHPDDGWVSPTLPLAERRDGSIHPSYPRFDHHPQVGDLIALGAHYNSAPWKYRLVRVTEVKRRGGILGPWIDYHFVDDGLRLPEQIKRRRWWRR